jgi:hypothetical protein
VDARGFPAAVSFDVVFAHVSARWASSWPTALAPTARLGEALRPLFGIGTRGIEGLSASLPSPVALPNHCRPALLRLWRSVVADRVVNEATGILGVGADEAEHLRGPVERAQLALSPADWRRVLHDARVDTGRGSAVEECVMQRAFDRAVKPPRQWRRRLPRPEPLSGCELALALTFMPLGYRFDTTVPCEIPP